MPRWPDGSGFRWYIFLAAFLVLPNIPLLLAAHPLSLLVRGYIDLDYLVIGLLSLFVPPLATFILLFAAVVLDFIHATCVTYLFAPAEFLHVMRYGGLLSTTRIGLIVYAFLATLLICAAITACTSRRAAGRQRRIALVTIVVLFLLLVLADIPNVRRILRPGEGHVVRLTRTPTASLIYSQYTYDRYERGMRVGGMYAMPSAASLALNHLPDYPAHDRPDGASGAQDLQPNLVLVLVESWGSARDPALRDAIVEPFSDPVLESRYKVLRGTMPFAGPTTSGEKRELCQSYMGMDFDQGTQAQLDRCVPLQMRRAGYRTLAVHGFSGDFYNRKEWYPKLGFDDNWFHDRLRAAGLPDCPGPFTGSCDDAVAAWAGERLRQRGNAPLFLYWVTLNSHLPVPNRPVLKSPPS
ncbi:MAG TPA: sulfatase-like hydrolase/transferase, partial [Silvibacterium sp.]|nr:sulfatase-like hydrolase/transferase [Silvibacterium sp.]